ncbi:hypothetical protein [Nocardioides sp.]|uniref:nucleotidyltransferase domain-containing protein n=1 Tax=Nocardioides sp. TaxID=35761 RepID=UPI002717C3F9|nr:hypothetical protein [Nocardioides sp.]MDO9457643.1 hypothetical protein [Nocardioides sp.]
MTSPTPQHEQPDQLDDEDFFRWYGDWEPLTPSTIGAFMAGFDRPWWVIGGWAVEVFTGVAREHDDLDVSIFAHDAEAFRLFLGDRWTPWNADSSWLRPFDARFPDIDPESQLWVREHSGAPWVLDMPLTLATDGLWTNKRFHDHVAPLDEVTWVADDGLRYLRPEVSLMMKARLDRPKDRADLAVALPLLDDAARSWLWAMVERAHPGHPWLAAYAG